MAAVLRVCGPTQSRYSAVLGELCWLSRGTCVSGALKWGCRCARMGGGCWTVESFSQSQAWSSATCSLDLLGLRELWGHNLATGVEAKWLLEPIPPKRSWPHLQGQPKLKQAQHPTAVTGSGKHRAKYQMTNFPFIWMNIFLTACPFKTLLICSLERKKKSKVFTT